MSYVQWPACLASPGAPKLTMRPLSEDFIEQYVEQVGEPLLSTVGAYQLEGLGAQLFNKIEGITSPFSACRYCRCWTICVFGVYCLMTWLLGVIGDPVSHSLSPLIHKMWIREYGFDATYEALRVERGELESALGTLSERKCTGIQHHSTTQGRCT